MSRQILTGRRSNAELAPYLDELYQFRYTVFKERLQWNLATHGNRELDQFDQFDPLYVLITNNQHVTGCARLLPTTGPYMLKDIFPYLTDGKPLPAANDVWELTRFAVFPDAEKDPRAAIHRSTADVLRAVGEAASANGVNSCLAVTNLPVERLMRRTGLPIERLGKPRKIVGHPCVALSVQIDVNYFNAVQQWQEQLAEAEIEYAQAA